MKEKDNTTTKKELGLANNDNHREGESSDYCPRAPQK